MLKAELKSMELRIMAVYQDCNDLKSTSKKNTDCFGIKTLQQRQADEVKLEVALTKCRDIEREVAAFQQRVTEAY